MYLKRQKSPKNWPIKRKGTAYIVKPNYNTEQGLPILIIIRDVLKLAKDRKEVKKAINSKQILLNNRIAYNEKDNALLFDTVTIIPPKESNLSEKHYRIIMNLNKKFDLKEINSSEAFHKIAKVINKTTLKGKKMQINLSDGRNFISNIKCRVNDSVLINLKDKKLEKCISLKKEAKAVVFAGKHAGESGVIKEVDKEDRRVTLERNEGLVNVLIKQLIVVE